MKISKLKIFICLVTCFLSAMTIHAQVSAYTYQTAQNDPLNAKIYTLKNGLKVYMSVYKDVPRIQCYVAVRVGSKNDPAQTTGLAHYLEHLMFKGTSQIGTTDWAQEKPLLDRIEELFELYRVETDAQKRADYYHIIDSLSYIASGLAIPNEYVKIMKFIGSQGTNAWTSNDNTVYTENIPSNELENWVKIQADRFQNPVIRLFHTELETVYEEKNRSLSNDARKANEVMLSALFPNHPYGTQTTLGEAEHLKNPSITNIKNFVKKYYVPNNVAICLSGDFDPHEAIQLIEKYFRDWESQPIEPMQVLPEKPLNQIVEKEVTGLEAEFVRIAFPIGKPANAKEIYLLKMLDNIMNNGKSGLIDLNINQKQLMQSASSYPYVLCDNSAYVLYGKPKTGQTLQEVKDLLISQIDLIRKGQFDDGLMEASINNMRLGEMRQLENNQSRAMWMANAFMNNVPWQEACQSIQMYSDITKQDVIDFANKYLLNNEYVVVYKRQGTPPQIANLPKPAITPIQINRDVESDFFAQIKKNEVATIDPVFCDYENEISFLNLNGIPVYAVENTENETFTLQMTYPMGELTDKRLPIAAAYVKYLGTKNYTPEAINSEFYRLACNMSASCSDEDFTISISGLSENFEKAFQLAMHLFVNAQPNDTTAQNVIGSIIKNMNDAKTNQDQVLNALRSYCEYGESLVNFSLKPAEIKQLSSKELVELLQKVLTCAPEITYYGPANVKALKKTLKKYCPIPKKFETYPTQKFEQSEVTENQVFYAPYDAKQARLVTFSRGPRFNKELMPLITMYNRYFGGGMNAIVFQEMREKRSLAYTAQSQYIMPSEKEDFMYNYSFIGTQNDKILDAFTAFDELFNDMPVAQADFELAKDGVKTNIATNRITKANILYSFINNKKLGFDYDYRRDIYQAVDQFTMEDVIGFNNKYIKNLPKKYMILAKDGEVDFPALEVQYGKVNHLTLEQIFGY
ncbi:MAG: insulinase family protein [Bacteroidales bacterium]|nr:insulinase family protein [Bacteroidales bacterium]